MNDIGMDTFGVPESAWRTLSPPSQALVSRLLLHEAETPDLSAYASSKLAAVLILLYEKAGQIKVLLTTRSKLLRSHPGQTALPGGKCDESDRNVVETAYREAHEEVALPLHSPNIFTLCLLRPFLSLHKLLVTPVVALLIDLSLLDNLSPSDGEVDGIFEHPLEAILDPILSADLALVPKGSEHWPYDSDLHSTTDSQFLAGSNYRMHRFRSTASPIKGLTADILIMAAEIAYSRSTVYERFAPGQMDTFAATARILEEHERLEKEKNKAEVNSADRIAREGVTASA